ncbi:TldD/PmbA family protein, partial [Candidatus Aerophobetes bacterium]
MERILDQAISEAQEAEVYQVRSQVKTVKFQANRLKSVDSASEEGIGLRVIRKGKIGFSSTTDGDDPHLLIQRALDSSQFGQEAHFRMPSPGKVPLVNCYDRRTAALELQEMIEEGEKAIHLVRKKFPYLECEAEIEKMEREVSIINSRGLSQSYKKTDYQFFLYGFLAREEEFLGVGEEESSSRYRDSSRTLAERLIELVSLAKRRVGISSGKYPAIFTSKAVPLLLGSLKMGINGKVVQKKVSPLLRKMRTSIASSSLNIVDDATFPFGPASSPLDGEGIPSRPTRIIEKGRLKSFIYDLQTAGLMRTRSTANAARSYDSLPSPSTTNLILKEGKVPFEEMIQDIKEGILVDQVIGSGQGNTLMGEFSVNLDLGYKIEDGKIKGRVKDVMISGNTYKMLKELVAIG